MEKNLTYELIVSKPILWRLSFNGQAKTNQGKFEFQASDSAITISVFGIDKNLNNAIVV